MTGAGRRSPWRRYSDYAPMLPDWEPRFNAWLEEAAARPHDFGRHDCLLMPAGAILAQTGRDHGRGHRGRYRTARGAARYLRRLGFDTAGELLDSILPRIPAALAQRGDIVATGEGVAGVCTGGEALFLVEGGAAVSLPRSSWSGAWAIGRGPEPEAI